MADQYNSPITGVMRGPYDAADVEHDINQRTSPSEPSKLAEDAKLARGKGPIKPLTRVDLQLRGEDNARKARRSLSGRR